GNALTVDQMRRGGGHATGRARGAEAARLARRTRQRVRPFGVVDSGGDVRWFQLSPVATLLRRDDDSRATLVGGTCGCRMDTGPRLALLPIEHAVTPVAPLELPRRPIDRPSQPMSAASDQLEAERDVTLTTMGGNLLDEVLFRLRPAIIGDG